ncbi:MAG: MBL fold metallo-hydrolase [Ferrovibrio sp.]|uniref:MBL fold metallo-hydrolase n=1 Tax=Ferrovibrio sp. TaxID=1917215 RepID=UPI00391C6ACF
MADTADDSIPMIDGTPTPDSGASLKYPFANEPNGGRPGDGAVMQMRPGVLWLRMPIPIPGLDYINLWLLEDGEGWTLVDTGVRSSKLQAIWEQVIVAHLGGKPITRILCTHFHPDHLGLAGWLQQKFDAPLWMTLGEWSFGRMLELERSPEVPADVVAFYERLGFDAGQLDAIRSRGFGNFAKAVTPIPRGFHRMSEGDIIRIGTHDWQVIIGRGHSPEHACLYCPSLDVLISGDQVLPRISPHIGVYPGEPEAGPLTQYLDSFAKFSHLPRDILVLPAHGDPFIGLHQRIAMLQRHHATRLDALLAALERPHTVIETLPLLFRRDISDHMTLAAGEALAHLHHLMREGLVARRLNEKSVYEFQRCDSVDQAAQ